MVEKALYRIEADIAPDPVTGMYDSLPERMADALSLLASTAIAEDADADRATVVVHVDRATIEARRGMAELEDSAVLPLRELYRLACDCRIQWSADAKATPVGVGRTTRTVPRWLFRQLQRRDGGCRYPGCGRTRWLHAHHIVHWANGGPTDLRNLILLCTFHHRGIHRLGAHIEGDPAGPVRFIRSDGASIPGPAPPALEGSLRDAMLGWVPRVPAVSTT